MANHQEDDRKEEGARAGPRGHPHATDMQTHTAGVLDEQRQAEQQEARGIRGYGEPAFPGLRAVRHAGHPARDGTSLYQSMMKSVALVSKRFSKRYRRRTMPRGTLSFARRPATAAVVSAQGGDCAPIDDASVTGGDGSEFGKYGSTDPASGNGGSPCPPFIGPRQARKG